ncbi:MAG: bifunctional DNA-binding transcriptional regulator/O6-methylguanine-DNA methyltransferase Ada [Burkholderiales bacterium]|nr:bifunctional DNA-binding transcriptional regulator/O6-methylguanine-DNA methyltransferase Ada [Burkholderiales bacterium]
MKPRSAVSPELLGEHHPTIRPRAAKHVAHTRSRSRILSSTPKPAYDSDERRWQAVSTRDRHADGQFVYSVRTTGVYCRPSCGSRLPRRENVAFHRDAAAAERAGLRACKRCLPDRPEDRYTAALARACRAIEAADSPLSLAHLAALAGLSRYHFQRIFTAVIGVTPKAYASACRRERLRGTLASRQGSITAALYAAGFNSSSRFYAHAPGALGMTPSRYRNGAAGECIGYAFGVCSLGTILVAATAKGVCAIALGDRPQALLDELRERFPRAELVPAGDAFESTVARVVALVEQPSLALALPLDIRGTAFQQRVWQALAKIPAGETTSYAALAGRIGMPTAARAVGHACAANPLAVAIPCHRVLCADGMVSGYRWGEERKRALLEREKKR